MGLSKQVKNNVVWLTYIYCHLISFKPHRQFVKLSIYISYKSNIMTQNAKFKLLAVFLNEHLTLNKHMDHVTAKLSRALYLLNCVKQFVSPSSLR